MVYFETRLTLVLVDHQCPPGLSVGQLQASYQGDDLSPGSVIQVPIAFSVKGLSFNLEQDVQVFCSIRTELCLDK